MSGPRPVRAAADGVVEVSCTVNGKRVTLSVPPRLTLADALRDRLGLTGTHVGCEHGVCGMCTVLVDGCAARSCIVFACQLDGAEIVTVEGLGTPDRQHPLQEAFARHHALQCGFCTPGFLMSAYDLLRHQPDVTAEELPEELSGVLCRCTGYRNIAAAVAEVASQYRDGVPEPLNCQQRVQVAVPERERNLEVVLPEGPPTTAVEVASDVAAPVAAVWAVLSEVRRLATCLPGAELTEELGEDRYAGRARVSLGPIRLSFDGVAQVVERDPDGHRMVVLAKGSDVGGGGTQARLVLAASAVDGGTRLAAVAEVYLTGRIAQFGRALAGDVSRRMFEEFAVRVEEAAVSGEAPGRVRGASGLRLAWGVMWERIWGWVARRRR